MGAESTLEQIDRGAQTRSGAPTPGLVVVFSAREPRLAALPVEGAAAIRLGRDALPGDAHVSRRHAEVARAGEAWIVRDLGSRNGTFVDGARVAGELHAERPRVLRVGDTVLLFQDDVRPFVGARVRDEHGVVIGVALSSVWDEARRLAASSETLHLKGATGTGKEVVAQQFHRSSPRAGGPFVAVNCAAIVPQLAERLLFGTRKGAYSGADANAPGHFQAADGGTLFLDEVAELSLEVQAKLLRAIETREVQPLGAARAHAVDVRVCSATHGDLRAAVAANRFREDLYFRIGLPALHLPELCERLEDVSWLVCATLARVAPRLRAHASLVEVALGRRWPGNVRELAAEITNAARRVSGGGDAEVRAEHLAPHAGDAFPASAVESPEQRERARLEQALLAEDGNVAGAARALGLHRTQVRRLIERYQVSGARRRKPKPGSDAG